MAFVDLSHSFENGMPGFRLKNSDGSVTQYTAKISPFLTHEQTLPMFKGKCSFEITQMEFQTSIGTYLDAPFHRYPEKKDIGDLNLEDLILDGIVIDAREISSGEELDISIIDLSENISGKAVLFNFGWDRYWGQEQYHTYPFISKEIIETLVEKKVGLVGVDTINIDNSQNLERPAHSKLLANDILILENMANIHKLHGQNFRLFAVPIKAKATAAIPVRAFAEI
ncbi:MAG: cyclase family protein [Candidatus Kariarchaeaceae archaeon]|jgi:kynurenine formamidase